MHYNVPQFIDIEDKIVGPLTAKQLLWLFGLAAALFLLWVMIDNKATFIAVALPISLLFLALAFYRPYGQPFGKFLASMFIFLVKPKIYMWRRGGETRNLPQNVKRQSESELHPKKAVHQREVYDLSKILDSEPDILNEINKRD
jgi:hypothetical protein